MFEFVDHNGNLVTLSVLHFVSITQYDDKEIVIHCTSGGPHRTRLSRAELEARINAAYD